MKPAILAGAVCLLALTAMTSSNAQAGISIEFSSGYSHNVHRGHRQHPGHNVHRGHRSHSRHGRRHTRDIAPGHYRGHNRDHYRGHDDGYRKKHRRRHHHHRPSRSLSRTECRPVYTRSYDRYGREIMLRETLCFRRFGRPFIADR